MDGDPTSGVLRGTVLVPLLECALEDIILVCQCMVPTQSLCYM